MKRFAHPGEKVLIVIPKYATDYDEGDVFEVEDVTSYGAVFFSDRVGESNAALYGEYVVLEPLVDAGYGEMTILETKILP